MKYILGCLLLTGCASDHVTYQDLKVIIDNACWRSAENSQNWVEEFNTYTHCQELWGLRGI